ncbi:myo-inositol-1(or 4)-monophosphatase [Palleronia marisminoris]|uniref:inositol monophosphatase family protein n=1 Tax=Palleronia marisminoris TaxID=315423 RepID=UPI0008F17CC2|nr:inositol monophosphatase [Palleronia marisminoris]SFH27054.1 myo-inositol-1(or 4)-monophosphatase [Palleronia marisminoris]
MHDPNSGSPIDPALLEELEDLAVELARLAAAEIEGALGTVLTVRYKGDEAGQGALRDPVSEVDQRVEKIMRMRLDERFPEHDIIGEEYDDRPGRNHDFVWAVDPIDGTTNFVNGFPLFAAAIGVLYKGKPIVGATWCSTSHALRPGVYHARAGGSLRFDGEDVALGGNPGVKRRLVGLPQIPATAGPRDGRKTGSAAIELAFVAAGLLEACRIDTPNIWDVASGLALVEAAGGRIATRSADFWYPFERFEEPQQPRSDDLRQWKQPVLAGCMMDHDALVAAVAE